MSPCQLGHRPGQPPTTKGDGQMKRASLMLAALTMLAGGERVRAGVIGSYHLYSFGSLGSVGSQDGTFSGDFAAAGFATGVNVNGGQTYISDVKYQSSFGTLGLQLSGSTVNSAGEFNGPLAGGNATITWQDAVTLVWKGNGVPAVIPGTNLDFILRPEGSLTVGLGDNTNPDTPPSSASVGIVAGLTSLSYTVNTDFFGGLFHVTKTAFPTAEASFSIGPGGKTQFSYSLGISVSTEDGTALSDFLNTLSLDAITFDNGQTPESLGYDLVFDSGMQSPNLSAVPEPASLTLLGIAAASGLGYFGWRRRKLAAI